VLALHVTLNYSYYINNATGANNMLDKFKEVSMKADRELGGYYKSKTDSVAGIVECIAQQVPKLHNSYHWRFNFKLNGKVISAKKLELELLK